MNDVNAGGDAAAQAAASAAAATAAAAAAAARGTPWHTGVEPEVLGFWQNKGLPLDDPKAFAVKLTEQYRSAEKHIGAPPDQLLRMPKADAKPEEIKAFWARLGAGGEAKDYDLSSVKDAAGQPISQALADAIRGVALEAYLPKEATTKVAAGVVKALDAVKAAESAVATAALTAEKTKLQENWKEKFDFNRLTAMEGARRLGITPEAVKALEGQIGYAAVMEAMRKIGAGTSEDTFVERGVGGTGVVTTREGAISRKAELERDQAWGKRYLAGGVAEKTEMDALIMMIDGAS